MVLTGGGALLRDLDRLLDGRDRPAGDRRRGSADLRGARLRHGARADGASSGIDLRTTEPRMPSKDRRPPPAMPLGTLDRWTPPPFFRQGPSALTKLSFFSALAIFLMVVDTRFRVDGPAARADGHRAVLPAAGAAGAGGGLAQRRRDHLLGFNRALSSEEEHEAPARGSGVERRRARIEQLRAENTRLRSLLELRPALQVRSAAGRRCSTRRRTRIRARSSSTAAQPRASRPASPVIDESGVIGQVTRVFPFFLPRSRCSPTRTPRSPCRTCAARRAAPPSASARRRARNALHGRQRRRPERRPARRPRDVDGIFPPGLPVAKVATVDRKVDSGFARILLTPTARSRQRAPPAGAAAGPGSRCRRSRSPSRQEPKPAMSGKKGTRK